MDQILSFIKKITSFIQKQLVCRFCKRCCYIQSEERSDEAADQNGQYTLQVSTPEVLDPPSDNVSVIDIDADSSFRLHQNVGTNSIDIVEGNKQEQESVSRVLNVEISEERQIVGSVPEISEDLEDRNGQYTLPVSTPEVLDRSSGSVSVSDIEEDSSFRLHQNVDTICIDIVEGNKQEQESVSCVLNVEILEERQIAVSVPEISEDLKDQNGQCTLQVSPPEVLDALSDNVSVSDIDADSSFRLHENVGTSTCMPSIVLENNRQRDSVSCVFSVETLEKGKIVASVPERRISHYCSTQRILLVGDGDFSFSASLARAFGSATNMVATSLDSRVTLRQKYSGAMANLAELEGLGCTIIHELNCWTMCHHARLKSELFDRIVYNFPHAGVFSESKTWVIEAHTSVVSGFLRNAVKMLRENGEVHVTHKTAHPFNKWEIKKLANEAGLWFFHQVPFSLSDYPGYRNKYGAGRRSDESFPVGASSTFKFKKNY